MYAGNIIGRIFGKSADKLINYRILSSLKETLIICNSNELEIINILPYLRKIDLILAPEEVHYFTGIFTDLKIRYYNLLKEVSSMVELIKPDQKIMVNLNPHITLIPKIKDFHFRVGKFASHRFPDYNLLIKGQEINILFKIMNRKSRKRIPIKFAAPRRRKIISYYRSLKKKGYKKVIYLKETRPKDGFQASIFYCVESEQKVDLPNTRNIQPRSYESMLYSYYADEFLGSSGPQSFLRKFKK